MQCLDGIPIPGKYARHRAVVHGQCHGVFETSYPGRKFIDRQFDGQHPAGARDGTQRGTAARHHERTVGETQRTGDSGGRDLALAVADDQIGNDAHGAPHSGDAERKRPQHRLHLIDVVEPIPPGRTGNDREGIPVHVWCERGGAIVHHRREGRVCAVQRRADAVPLRALSGEDEGHAPDFAGSSREDRRMLDSRVGGMSP